MDGRVRLAAVVNGGGVQSGKSTVSDRRREAKCETASALKEVTDRDRSAVRCCTKKNIYLRCTQLHYTFRGGKAEEEKEEE